MKKHDNGKASSTSADAGVIRIVAATRDLLNFWAQRIEHMPPLAAQRFIASNTSELLFNLSKACGEELAKGIVDCVEREAWDIYDRLHRPRIAT